MSRTHVVLLIAAALIWSIVVGKRALQDPDRQGIRPTAALPTVEPTPAAPKPSPRSMVVPDVALSTFMQRGGTCIWELLDPKTLHVTELARFTNSCDGVRASWSPDRTRAIVTFNHATCLARGSPQDDTEGEMYAAAYIGEIDLLSKTVRTIPVPSNGTRAAGFDAEGRIAAVTFEKGVSVAALERFNWSASPEHSAYQIYGTTGWKVVETSPDEYPDLAWYDRLDPARTGAVLRRQPSISSIDLEIDGYDQVAWFELADVLGLRAAIGKGTDAYGEETTGPLLFLGKRPKIAEKTHERRSLAIAIQDNWILVVTRGSGLSPRLYDSLEGKLVYESDSPMSVTFWPKPE